ncbi:MAG TPA: LutB/LldF family L-lactate oxidation iron-sulfur protein [Bryobacteraceae bacterium]|nr:LutB/LldF family L-lactate oxidation iron-sulfur protein [Bryobacteraceae bacterium]
MKLAQIEQTLGDPRLQKAIYSATARLADGRRKSVADLAGYQDLRERANQIKKHTIEHLDFYLEELERNLVARGGQVIWANTAEEARDFVSGLARERGVKLVVKSKSMTSEEIHLNDHLEHAGIEAVETDLGEYIIQLAHEKPYHIIAPALHKTREQVAEALHADRDASPERLTAIARATLREKFLAAGMGITGANFLVADAGAVVIVENEGNARLSSSAPAIHIAIAGMEKIIPRAQDLAIFLKLLARSATGQPLSVYTSFLAGPRRAGEADGPGEFYLVLVDNGRTRVLADREKRQSLYCIRCGACLNNCPVYRKIGGYSYPWVYSGPIGKILTPQFMPDSKGAQWLPFASSLCGACGEVCPVKIEIPKILLEFRRDSAKPPAEKAAFRIFSWVMRHPAAYEKFRWLRRLRRLPAAGPLKAWLSQRDLPELPARSFREEWRRRVRG